MIDEATTTITVLEPLHDPADDHFDPDQTTHPKAIASGLRANISVATSTFVEGTRSTTTYRLFADPFPVQIGQLIVDERSDARYSLRSGVLRVDADYPDDLDHPSSLSHVAGEVVAVTGVAVGT